MKNLVLMLLVVGGMSCQPAGNDKTKEAGTLQDMESPATENTSLPYLTTDVNEDLLLSWVEKKGDTAMLKYSLMMEGQWGNPETIASGTDWFVNWADYPMITADPNGNMMAHFLAKSSSGTYSYDVNMRTRVAGSAWSASFVPHDDGTPTEHGFVTMIPVADNKFQVAWLDGRLTGGGDHGHGGGGAMTIRTAVIDVNGNKSEEVELDNRVCDCCQTSGALTDMGPVVVYRDRSDLEIRDMSIVRKVDGKWTTPQTIYADNWEIAGCPVNGPRADAIGNTLVVGWFSAPNGQASVRVTFSDNSGETFSNPITIDDANPLGRVDVAMINSEQALVIWMTMDGEKTLIKGRKIHNNGTMDDSIVISETNESRGSGFPQLAVTRGTAYIAWTSLQENGPGTVRIRSLTL